MQLESIADHLDRIDLIARWHFADWGYLDPSNTLEAWTVGLRQRTRRDQIPTTYVAFLSQKLTAVEKGLCKRILRHHLSICFEKQLPQSSLCPRSS